MAIGFTVTAVGTIAQLRLSRDEGRATRKVNVGSVELQRLDGDFLAGALDADLRPARCGVSIIAPDEPRQQEKNP